MMHCNKKKLGFASRYTITEEINITPQKKQWIFQKNQRSEELHAITRHLVLRMKKEDVLKLHPHIRSRIYIGDISPLEKEHFKTQMEKITSIKYKNKKDCLLMQLTRDTTQIKAPHIIEYIRKNILLHNEKKCIIFTHHLHLQEKISEFLKSENVDHIVINGNTNMDVRMLELDRLKNVPETKIGLLSLGACSTGLNIAFISLVLVAELTFNAITHIQAEGRCHRTGQTETVYTKYLMMQNTTDDMVWSNIMSKEATQEKVLDNNNFSKKKRPWHNENEEEEVKSDSD